MSSVSRGIAGSRVLVRRLQTAVGNEAHAAIFSSAPRHCSTATPPSIRALCRWPVGSDRRFVGIRHFSDAGKISEEAQEETKDEEEVTAVEGEGKSEVEEGEGDDDSTAEKEEEAAAPQSREEELDAQVKDLRNQLLRSLAEQENTRRIAKRDVDAARSYAVTSFAKSLLDTSDNLARALEAVPPEFRDDSESHPVLATLYEGIKMTDDGLTKAFEKNGLTKFGDIGEKFDPNLHEALFEYFDPEKDAGTIGQVMKTGFMLNKRVVRPAEVGVVKKA